MASSVNNVIVKIVALGVINFVCSFYWCKIGVEATNGMKVESSIA